ncbi:MAG: lipid A deacylase LpxR family protein [Bacteroidales bacterium]|nr:lipid A deacylase LpxR family protein [Bacteroidales bacterium]
MLKRHVEIKTLIFVSNSLSVIRLATYMLLISILLAVGMCNNSVKKIADRNQTKSEESTNISPEAHFISPLPAIESFQIAETRTDTIYSSHHHSNVAREVPLSIQEMALKNAGVEPTVYSSPAQGKNTYFKTTEQFWQLRVLFENDIFANTDFYYTNGVNIAFTTPLARTGLYFLLAGTSKKPDVEATGFSFTQKIYTPTNPDVDYVITGDRPFSGYLTLEQFRETYSIKSKLMMRSSLEFGVLGPASFGGKVQSSIHQIEPIGWDNQIKNMVVVNYRFLVEKGLISNQRAELNLTGSVSVGTAFNNLQPGLYFRAGQFIPVLRGEASILEKPNWSSDWQYWFFVNMQASVVFYDATLQGSLFSDNSTYTIQANQLNRFVPQAAAGLALYYKRAGMEVSAHYLSPEFKGARTFRWGGIRLIYSF